MATKSTQIYESNGIAVSPVTPKVGDSVKLTYSGFLAKNGASNVYAHYGYGQSFENLSDVKMTRKKNGGFELSFNIKKPADVCMCFRDDNNNWDNNSGLNYVISTKTTASKATASKSSAKTAKTSAKTTAKASKPAVKKEAKASTAKKTVKKTKKQ